MKIITLIFALFSLSAFGQFHNYPSTPWASTNLNNTTNFDGNLTNNNGTIGFSALATASIVTNAVYSANGLVPPDSDWDAASLSLTYSNNQSVTVWKDSSGNGNLLYGQTANEQFFNKGFNPYVFCNGGGFAFAATNFFSTNTDVMGVTVLTVFRSGNIPVANADIWSTDNSGDGNNWDVTLSDFYGWGGSYGVQTGPPSFTQISGPCVTMDGTNAAGSYFHPVNDIGFIYTGRANGGIGAFYDGKYSSSSRLCNSQVLVTNAFSATNFFIGGNQNNSFPWNGNLYRLVVFFKPLTHAQIAAWQTYLETKYCQPAPTVIIDGDSISKSLAVNNGNGLSACLYSAFGGQVIFKNLSFPSQNSSNLLYHATNEWFDAAQGKIVDWELPVINDAQVLSLANSETNYISYTSNLHSNKNLVIWKTIESWQYETNHLYSFGTGLSTNLNNWIYSNWTAQADILVDYRSNTNWGQLGSWTNTLYFSADGIHPNQIFYQQASLGDAAAIAYLQSGFNTVPTTNYTPFLAVFPGSNKPYITWDYTQTPYGSIPVSSAGNLTNAVAAINVADNGFGSTASGISMGNFQGHGLSVNTGQTFDFGSDFFRLTSFTNWTFEMDMMTAYTNNMVFSWTIYIATNSAANITNVGTRTFTYTQTYTNAAAPAYIIARFITNFPAAFATNIVGVRILPSFNGPASAYFLDNSKILGF